MKNRYYVQLVWGCVDSLLHGPFDTPLERDAKAREIAERENMDKHAIFRLNVLVHGRDVVFDTECYTNAELFAPDAVDRVIAVLGGQS